MDISLLCQGGQNLKNTPVNVTDDSILKDNTIYKSQETYKDNKYDVKDNKDTGKNISKLLERDKTHAEYSVNKAFGDIVIKIVDDDTKKIVQEIPSEKILNMIQKFCEMDGVLIDEKA